MIKKLIVCVSIVFIINNAKAAFVTQPVEQEAEKQIKAFTDAAYTNKKDRVEAFLKEGIDINSKGHGGQTALQRAASQGHVEMVAFLLQHGANPNSADKQDITPLIAAVMSYPSRPNVPGIEAMVNILIARGANLDAQNKSGQTALMIAIASQLPSIIQILLNAGANIWQKNSFNEGPLDLIDDKTLQALEQRMQAAPSEKERESLEQQLTALKHIRSLFEAKERNVKAFLEAASTNNVATIESLLKAGTLINVTDAQGRTALHLAAREGHQDIVAFLLKKGADIESKDATGQTPLHLAAGNGQAAMVEFLLEKGAHPASVDKENNTPLMTAIKSYPKYRNLAALSKIVSTFLEKKVAVNHQNKSGQTALILATVLGLDSIVQMLLDVGANIDLEDNLKRKAIDWAQFTKNSTIESMLKKTNTKTQEQRALNAKEVLSLVAEAEQFEKEEVRRQEEEAERQETTRLKAVQTKQAEEAKRAAVVSKLPEKAPKGEAKVEKGKYSEIVRKYYAEHPKTQEIEGFPALPMPKEKTDAAPTASLPDALDNLTASLDELAEKY